MYIIENSSAGFCVIIDGWKVSQFVDAKNFWQAVRCESENAAERSQKARVLLRRLQKRTGTPAVKPLELRGLAAAVEREKRGSMVKARVAALRADGKRNCEIARAVGLTPQRVGQIVNELDTQR